MTDTESFDTPEQPGTSGSSQNNVLVGSSDIQGSMISVPLFRAPGLESTEELNSTAVLWKIKNFRKLRVKEIGDCITSDLFASLSGCVWTIALYPVGNKKTSDRDIESKKYVSLYLRLDKSSTVAKVNVIFKFYTRSKTSSGRLQNRLLVGSETPLSFKRDSDESAWGFPKALKRGDLNSHLDDNCLTLRCLIILKTARNVIGVGLKRKLPHSPAPNKSSSEDNKTPSKNLSQVHLNLLQRAFPNIQKLLRTVDCSGDTPKRRRTDVSYLESKGLRCRKRPGQHQKDKSVEELPSEKTVDTIIRLIVQDSVDSKLTIKEYLDTAMWCNKLGIQLAERTFYWLIGRNLTFPKAVEIMNHRYFNQFQEPFKKIVYVFVIKNMSLKHKIDGKALWETLKRDKPQLIAEIYRQLMEITKVQERLD